VTSSDERHPYFSPDGKWIAYSSDESGVFQVYVRAFPDNGGKWQISDEGGLYPIWPREGNEIFFRTEDSHIMSARYHVNGDTFEHEKARLWTPTAVADISLLANYDVSADGQRVLALMETAQSSRA
jgi:Tol biopolymer transport system component